MKKLFDPLHSDGMVENSWPWGPGNVITETPEGGCDLSF